MSQSMLRKRKISFTHANLKSTVYCEEYEMSIQQVPTSCFPPFFHILNGINFCFRRDYFDKNFLAHTKYSSFYLQQKESISEKIIGENCLRIIFFQRGKYNWLLANIDLFFFFISFFLCTRMCMRDCVSTICKLFVSYSLELMPKCGNGCIPHRCYRFIEQVR